MTFLFKAENPKPGKTDIVVNCCHREEPLL